MSDRTINLYSIMGLEPDASPEQIKRVYRDAARRLHPDVNPYEGAAIQFRDIASAYETLSNDKLRSTYDAERRKMTMEIQNFNVRCIPSKSTLPVIDEPHILYLLAEISPAYKNTEPRRTPLNIALVLDRSSSMNGMRMDRVKKAARDTVDKLDERDRLSIISFSDKSDVLLKSTHIRDAESNDIKAAINMVTAGGGTEIYRGLSDGFQQVKRHFNRRYVNHIVLITDGRTYDDEKQSLELAEEARKIGIGISAMGIGDKWNDEFLDKLASQTGGTASLIRTPGEIDLFLDDLVRSLGDAYAERMMLTLAPEKDVRVESAFRLAPVAQPLNNDSQPMQLGGLTGTRSMLVLLQLQMPPGLEIGQRPVARLDFTGDVMSDEGRVHYTTVVDQYIDVMEEPPAEEPPPIMLDALGKLTLYRMQQKAESAISSGNVEEATRRLEKLATRLLEAGHNELATLANSEASRIARTKVFSEEGRKTLKFGTRALSSVLMLPPSVDD